MCNDVIPTVGVHTGRIVSGDQFISDSEKGMASQSFDGYCTEMEGAAIAQASYLNGIPFLIIRAISDKADNSAEMAYSKFEAIAIENTVKLLMGLIKQID